MKGESKEKKIRKVRDLRKEEKIGEMEREKLQAGPDNVSEEASAVGKAIRVHCFVE